MTETAIRAKPSLDRFVFVPKGATNTGIVTTPTFIAGELAQQVFEMYQQLRENKYGNNSNLQLAYQNEQLVGSNTFDNMIIDQIVRPFGIRTASVSDLSNVELTRMAKDNHYVDSRSLVLRSIQDGTNSRNSGLATELAKYVDMKQVEAGKPALMTGFTVEPLANDKKGYGLHFVPIDGEFSVIYDDRLSNQWNQFKFDSVDANGLPLDLDKKKGSRTWYTRNDGLSRLYLNRYLDVSSDGDRLINSDADGRVALFGGEAAGADFSVKLLTQVDQARSELSTRYEQANAIIETASQEAHKVLRGNK